MASIKELLNSIKPAGQTKLPVSSGTPVSFNIRDYQPGSTANSGSTSQQQQTPKQIINQATGGYSGGQTKLPAQNQSLAPKTGQQTVQNIVGNMQPNQTPVYNPTFNQQPSQANGFTTVTYVPPPVTREESAGIASNYGLTGLGKSDQFTGMTTDQANKAAKAKQDLYKTQTSAGTSYTYNPETISGFNEKIGSLKTKVDDINNSVWTSSGDKKTNVDSTIKSYTTQLAGLFNTPEEFQNALNTNPEFDKSVSEYQRIGGDVNAITSAISQKAQITQQGLGNGTQSLDQFLGKISTPAEKQAYESLIPEQKSLQMQIAFENGVVDKYMDYYFGDENQIGLIQQKKEMALEKANILDQQAKLATDNAKAQADLLIQKDNAQLAADEAEIEENQAVAKNYMTGMLAKLGALNTTGAAGEALVNLDIKYQKQKQTLKTNYQNRAREIEVKLNETVNNISSKKMEDIFKVKEDLSKDEETVMKEVFKLEADATRKSFDAVDKYLSMYRTQKDKYIKEAKDAAEKTARASAELMSTYNLSGLTFDNFLKSKSTGGEQTTIAGNSPIGGMSVTTGGQSFDPNQTQKMFPAYLQALIKSGAVSPETQEVLTGRKTVTDLTEAESKIAKRELASLKINPNTIQTTAKPEISTALSGARDSIDKIEASNLSSTEKEAKKKAIKQRFLENFPEKSNTYKEYFE